LDLNITVRNVGRAASPPPISRVEIFGNDAAPQRPLPVALRVALRDADSVRLKRAEQTMVVPVEEKLSGRFMIRSRTRVVQRHPKGDW
jgi:hypothetical protein